MTARILVVEDNADLADGLRHNLQREGYQVALAADGQAGLQLVREDEPDLVILDLMLPGLDGYQVLEGIRKTGSRVPVLILSARAEESDKVRGFRLDADQYVTKPFGLLELLERVRALLRRSAADHNGGREDTVAFGNVVVEPDARAVLVEGRPVTLTPKAFDLMMALIRREGAVASRVALLREVWGSPGDILTRTVDSHMAELRRKVEADPSAPRHFLTVWKVGYRFLP